MKTYLRNKLNIKNGISEDVTIVTACDEKYVEFLRLTFPNWRKYKNIDKHPVIVFVHGIDLSDERLDFLRLNNVTMIPWSFPEADDHREEMLSAFVFGAAENVKTDYWLKLDADSYATNYKPLYSEDMKKFAYCGHKWGYSRPEHIKKLDEWASTHWKRKLKMAKPMMKEGRSDGRRFYHTKQRTISYIQLHKLKFTKFCVSLLKKRKLPVPTQDTFMYYVCNRFDPHLGGVANFKRFHGFTQGNSRRSVDELRVKIENVDVANEKNVPIGKFNSEDDEVDDYVNDHETNDNESCEYNDDCDDQDNECEGNACKYVEYSTTKQCSSPKVEKVVAPPTPKLGKIVDLTKVEKEVEPKEEDFIFIIRETK
jgi:hypothetical protein